MLSRSALHPQRSRTAYFVVTNSHLLSLPQVVFLSSTFWFLSKLFFFLESKVELQHFIYFLFTYILFLLIFMKMANPKFDSKIKKSEKSSISFNIFYSFWFQFDFSSALRLNLPNVIWQADSTVSQLEAISEQLASAKHMGVLQVSLPANVQTEIEQIGEILSSSIAAITNSSNDIRDILNSV